MAVDIVVVPDFACAQSRSFEWQTFYLLASIAEYAKISEKSNVFVNCIGKPPVWLNNFGKYFNLSVCEKKASEVGGFHNKLQGLIDYHPTNNQTLLLDSDIMFLGPLESPILELEAPLIAAAIANIHHLPNEIWADLYKSLDFESSDDKSSSPTVHEQLNFPTEFKNVLYPYYNGGIVLFDPKVNLYTLWKKHINHYYNFIHTYDDEMLTERMKSSNQPSLATLIKEVQHSFPNEKTCTLPDNLHIRWQHIAAKSHRVEDIKLLHTIGILKNIEANDTPEKVHSKATDFAEWQIKNLHGMHHSKYNIKERFLIHKEIKKLKGMFDHLYSKYAQDFL